jgi:hypothetical protein
MLLIPRCTRPNLSWISRNAERLLDRDQLQLRLIVRARMNMCQQFISGTFSESFVAPEITVQTSGADCSIPPRPKFS